MAGRGAGHDDSPAAGAAVGKEADAADRGIALLDRGGIEREPDTRWQRAPRCPGDAPGAARDVELHQHRLLSAQRRGARGAQVVGQRARDGGGILPATVAPQRRHQQRRGQRHDRQHHQQLDQGEPALCMARAATACRHRGSRPRRRARHRRPG
jgi:hypothetical protein